MDHQVFDRMTRPSIFHSNSHVIRKTHESEASYAVEYTFCCDALMSTESDSEARAKAAEKRAAEATAALTEARRRAEAADSELEAADSEAEVRICCHCCRGN